MARSRIPFNRPFLTGAELGFIREAYEKGVLAGNGEFTARCNAWLEGRTGAARALLAHSCTAALEMSAILADIAPGDEIIMPSYTFVTTATAFVLRGGVPVFVDIREDTLNIDERRIEAAIGPRTRAIAVVHYAGVGCEMDSIAGIARKHGLALIEDAAQGLMAAYAGKPLGSFGAYATLSFHETKNVIAGEGGALLVNRPDLAERAEIVWQKGTNRTKFERGEVDKYTWVDVGSSFLPGELVAAFLWGQLTHADDIARRRLALWNRYQEGFRELERAGHVRRPVVPAQCSHNGHIYYLLMPSARQRTEMIAALNAKGINAVFHYVPLHSAPAGKRFGRAQGELRITEDLASRLVRLPLWLGMEAHLDEVIDTVCAIAPTLARGGRH